MCGRKRPESLSDSFIGAEREADAEEWLLCKGLKATTRGFGAAEGCERTPKEKGGSQAWGMK